MSVPQHAPSAPRRERRPAGQGTSRSSSSRRPAAALALLVALACGCSPANEAPRSRPGGPRLVVLLATCTLNKSFLEPYRPSVCWTPNLAALARESVVFERHESESGQSGCSFASIFTGTQADRHGIYHHPTELAEQSTTLAELFAAAGWQTHFWYGHPMASPELDYAQGVPPSNQHAFRTRQPPSLTPGDAASEALFAQLAADPQARAYVQANFTLTHGPYPVGRNPRSRKWLEKTCPQAAPHFEEAEFAELMALYDAHMRELQWDFDATVAELGLSPERVARLAQAIELAYTASVQQLDALLGAMLNDLALHGLLSQTLFVFTADHGEALHRAGLDFHWTHGLQLAPEVLAVPWIVRGPGLAPGRYAGVTRSIDLAPTLAGLAGVPVPPGLVDGVDLSPVLLGQAQPPHLIAYSHTTTLIPSLAEESREWGRLHQYFPRTDPALVWVRARDEDRVYKLRKLDGTRWAFQVFDLASDPLEAHDLADPEDAEQQEMRSALERYKERLVDGFEHAHLGERVGKDALQSLRGLGYAK